ncbi:MAG TPA: alpha-amylase family glycosyl hydrolase, partial [Burkholderiaceae bacterium]|nr:alpha-amylase family glycosyl hydrolase [Burkholderiaceae bacterium]
MLAREGEDRCVALRQCREAADRQRRLGVAQRDQAAVPVQQRAGVGLLRGDLLYTLEKLPVARLGTFLANHDFFAGARLMRQFAGDEPSYRLAAATLLTLPGTPFIYYGEEIGMTGHKPDERIRTPMRWDATEPAAGFSTAAPWQT